MANGSDTPRGGGADDHFKISLPVGTTTPNGGDFTVTPATPFVQLVIEGPGSLEELVVQEDGSIAWPIQGQWTIRVE